MHKYLQFRFFYWTGKDVTPEPKERRTKTSERKPRKKEKKV